MQVRRRIDLYFSLKRGAAVLFVGLLIVSLGGVQAADPPTFQTNVQEGSTTFSTSATYYSETTNISNSTIYDSPEIRQNARLYFTAYHKNLTIEPQTQPEPKNLETRLRLTASEPRNEEVVWSQTLSPDSSIVSVNNDVVVIHIAPLQNRLSEVFEELPSGLEVQLQVEQIATYDYKDSEFTQTTTTIVDITKPRAYEVQNQPVSEVREDIKTVERAEPSRSTMIGGTPYSNIGLLIIFVGMIFTGVGVYFIYGSRFDERTYEERLYQYHLEKYNSWITDGRPLNDPEFSADDVNKVVVDTLEGLVHISIDTKTRVIYSDELRRFYVFSDETLYTFNPSNIGGAIDTHDAATEAILNP